MKTVLHIWQLNVATMTLWQSSSSMGLILTALVKTETVLYTLLLVLATVMLWWLCFSMGLMLTFVINTVDFSPLLKQSCLHMATAAGNSDIVTILLQNRADVNCLDDKGLTPLNLAVIKGYTEIIKIQLLHGQEVTIMNGLGTVFYIWRESKITVTCCKSCSYLGLMLTALTLILTACEFK
jgi:hypothetical protein